MKNKKKKIAAVVVAIIVIAVLVQIGRHMGAYPVSPVPFGKGIGSTLYIASYEPYHPYLERQSVNWFYLFQAPLPGKEFDDTAEKIIFSNVASTDIHTYYRVETYRANPAYIGAEIVSQEGLFSGKQEYIQKKLNDLAPKTSEETPLYFVWCGGNLYGVIDTEAYLLWRGKGGSRWRLSLPEFQKPEYTPRVVSLGPISEDDYYEPPASLSTTS